MALNPEATSGTGPVAAEHPLSCGRSVEQLWEELESGRLAVHTRECVHCATARASLEQLLEATRMLVDDPIEPPVRLLERIMAAVRADIGIAKAIPLPTPMGGAEISVPALAAVLRFAVDAVPGVRAQRCRIEQVPEHADAVRVWMSVSLGFRSGRIDALDRARERAIAVLSQRVGLRLDRLDFQVADVWDDRDREPRK